MEFKETREKKIRGITITRDQERTFFLILSIDAHSARKDARSEALLMVYVHAILSGCGSYSRDEFMTALALIGASISVNADNGHILFEITSLDTHRSKLMALFKTMLTKPTFLPSQIKRIKQRLTNEIAEAKEDAKMRSLNNFINALYGKEDRHYHTFGDELIAQLEHVTHKSLKKFHQDLLGRNWTFTLASKPTDASKTRKELLLLQSTFKESEVERGKNVPNVIASSSVYFEDIPSKQNIEFNIGSSLQIEYGTHDYFAFLFGLNVLGKWGGFAGRLMSTVREKEGLTYGIYAKTEGFSKEEQGYYRIMTFFSPNKALQGLSSTFRELTLIKEKGITTDEFKRFKEILKTQETLLRDSLTRNVSAMHAYQLRGLSLQDIEEYKKQMFDLSLESVNSAIKKHIDVQKIIISAAGPVKNKEKEIKALLSIAKNGN